LSYYQKNVHKTVKARWSIIRNDITDVVAVSLGDEITNNPRPTWNQIATYLDILEVTKNRTRTIENDNFQAQNA
jgi:hypothetical protein